MAHSYSWKNLLFGRFELDNISKEAYDVHKGSCRIYVVPNSTRRIKWLKTDGLNLIMGNEPETDLTTLLQDIKTIAYRLPPATYYLTDLEEAKTYLYLGDGSDGYGGTWLEV